MLFKFSLPIPSKFKTGFIILSLSGSAYFFYLLWSKKKKYYRSKDSIKEKEAVSNFSFRQKQLLNIVKSVQDEASCRDLNSDTQSSIGRIGLNSLLNVILSLESALEKVQAFDDTCSDKKQTENELIDDLRELLAKSYMFKEKYMQILLLHDDQFAQEFIDEENTEDDTASFVTAAESLDLSELDYMINSNSHRPLFRNTLVKLKTDDISCRKVRTALVGCSSDVEYLTKLECLRKSFDYVLSQEDVRSWLIDSGSKLGCKLLACLDTSSTDYVCNYQKICDYMSKISMNSNSRDAFVEELKEHNIPVANFYDVVIDYILLDAFEHLADPPSTILSVTQNRWLSISFKRSALESAIWTILAAKRKMLRTYDGFFSFYYNLVASFVGGLSWGFLGTEENKNKLCMNIRIALLEYIKVIFSFHGGLGVSSSASGDFSTYFSLQTNGSCSSNLSDTASPSTIPVDNETLKNGIDEEETNTLINGIGDDSQDVTLKPNETNKSMNMTTPTKERLDPTPQPIIIKGLRYESLPELSQDLWTASVQMFQKMNEIVDSELRLLDAKSVTASVELNPVPVLDWNF